MRARVPVVTCVLVLGGCFADHTAVPAAASDDWICVGGDRGCARYSALRDIHRGNVHELEVAWTFRTGELDAQGRGRTIECTPAGAAR